MKIGLHDADAEHFRKRDKFPNYALIKISAWHKFHCSDTVEWWNAVGEYDKVYSSKVFSFTPENPYLPPDTIKGGTGYDVAAKLPPEIDATFPDYSIYPDCDYAIGFITRGCIRDCPWCIVPKKEGAVCKVAEPKDLIRIGREKLVLMDNNILALPEHRSIFRELMWLCNKEGRKIDFNQGLDARLVDKNNAFQLSRMKWIKYIRFACDNAGMIEPLMNAVRLLYERGVAPSRIFVYFLVSDIDDAMKRVRALRELGAITLYAQAYRDFSNGGEPISKEASEFAQRYIYPGTWRKRDWYDTPIGEKFKKGLVK